LFFEGDDYVAGLVGVDDGDFDDLAGGTSMTGEAAISA